MHPLRYLAGGLVLALALVVGVSGYLYTNPPAQQVDYTDLFHIIESKDTVKVGESFKVRFGFMNPNRFPALFHLPSEVSFRSYMSGSPSPLLKAHVESLEPVITLPPQDVCWVLAEHEYCAESTGVFLIEFEGATRMIRVEPWDTPQPIKLIVETEWGDCIAGSTIRASLIGYNPNPTPMQFNPPSSITFRSFMRGTSGEPEVGADIDWVGSSFTVEPYGSFPIYSGHFTPSKEGLFIIDFNGVQKAVNVYSADDLTISGPELDVPLVLKTNREIYCVGEQIDAQLVYVNPNMVSVKRGFMNMLSVDSTDMREEDMGCDINILTTGERTIPPRSEVTAFSHTFTPKKTGSYMIRIGSWSKTLQIVE